MSKTQNWELDSSCQQVKHRNGLCLQIEGTFKDPDGVVPVSIPKELAAMELVALIREGTDFCRQHKPSPQTVKAVPGASGRTVLSLKRSV